MKIQLIIAVILLALAASGAGWGKYEQQKRKTAEARIETIRERLAEETRRADQNARAAGEIRAMCEANERAGGFARDEIERLRRALQEQGRSIDEADPRVLDRLLDGGVRESGPGAPAPAGRGAAPGLPAQPAPVPGPPR
jgi:uncharacterized protein HemX